MICFFILKANTRNKKLLFDGIDALEARYVASYKKAVEFAYDALQAFTRQSKEEENIGTGANCHKLIMMFRYFDMFLTLKAIQIEM